MENQEKKDRVIGILFDVSGSMKQPFYDLSKKIQDNKEQVSRVDSIKILILN